jgi:hypothetical protein
VSELSQQSPPQAYTWCGFEQRDLPAGEADDGKLSDHGTSHAWHHLARNHPVGEMTFGIDLTRLAR